jgi:hypothetical protein
MARQRCIPYQLPVGRLEELGTRAEELAPGIVGKGNRWKSLVYDIRNRYAHHTSADWMDDDDLDRVLTAARSLRWLLRVLLLEQAGLSPEFLAYRFAAPPALPLLPHPRGSVAAQDLHQRWQQPRVAKRLHSLMMLLIHHARDKVTSALFAA